MESNAHAIAASSPGNTSGIIPAGPTDAIDRLEAALGAEVVLAAHRDADTDLIAELLHPFFDDRVHPAELAVDLLREPGRRARASLARRPHVEVQRLGLAGR